MAVPAQVNSWAPYEFFPGKISMLRKICFALMSTEAIQVTILYNCDHNISYLLPCFDILGGLDNLFQGVTSINNGFHRNPPGMLWYGDITLPLLEFAFCPCRIAAAMPARATDGAIAFLNNQKERWSRIHSLPLESTICFSFHSLSRGWARQYWPVQGRIGYQG